MNYLQIMNDVEADTEVENTQTIDEPLLTKGFNALRLKRDNLHSGRNGKKNEDKTYSVKRKAEKRGNLGAWSKRFESKYAHSIEKELVEDDNQEEFSLICRRDDDSNPRAIDLVKVADTYHLNVTDVAYVFGAVRGDVEDAEAVCFAAHMHQGEANLKTIADNFKDYGLDYMMNKFVFPEEKPKEMPGSHLIDRIHDPLARTDIDQEELSLADVMSDLMVR